MKERIERLQEKLRQKSLETILITHPANRHYLSGFDGTSGVLVVGLERCFLVTDFRYREQAEQQAPHCIVRPWQDDLPKSLVPLLADTGWSRLGFEKKHLTYALYQELSGKLEAELIPVEGLVEELRMVKDENEIEILKNGAACLDLAFSHILTFIKPGLAEEEVSLELEFFLRRLGAEGTSFRFIVASGQRGAMPHGVASAKKLASGELVTLDFGAVFESYATDMTRTVCLGKSDSRQEDIYEVVREAQRQASAALKPGMSAKEADAVARDIIKEAGFADQFGHGLGHAVGLETHELPVLSYKSEAVLEPGMVVTVEPGIYLPGWGGVRIEDMMLITETGAQTMTHSARELLII